MFITVWVWLLQSPSWVRNPKCVRFINKFIEIDGPGPRISWEAATAAWCAALFACLDALSESFLLWLSDSGVVTHVPLLLPFSCSPLIPNSWHTKHTYPSVVFVIHEWFSYDVLLTFRFFSGKTFASAATGLLQLSKCAATLSSCNVVLTSVFVLGVSSITPVDDSLSSVLSNGSDFCLCFLQPQVHRKTPRRHRYSNRFNK